MTRFSVSKNLSVVVKVFLNHAPGCPVIHNPRQVCVDLVNINSRVLVPWNDSDFTTGFIKWSQLFLALLKAYRIYYKEFFIISKKYFLIAIYFFTRGVLDSQFAEISWIKYHKLLKGNSTRNDPVIIWYCPEDLNQQASLSVLSFYNLFSGVWWMNRIYHTSGKFGSGPRSTTSLSWIKLANSLINRGLYT